MLESFGRWSQNRLVLVVVLMASYSIQSLLITASKRSGDFEYDVRATVLFAELLKLIFAVSVLPSEVRRNLHFRSSYPYTLPAVLYLLQNQLVFSALRHLSPPEYQLLNNGKLFTTSLIYRVVMKRPLRIAQWLALFLLGVGMALATKPDAGTNGIAVDSSELWAGVGLMIVVAWCSAIAGVSNEKLIKGSPSVVEANTWLYAYGCLACLVQLFFSADGMQNLLQLRGFTMVTWLVVLCNAVLGQSIAYIMKYADSIVKIYAVCAAMIFTTLASVFFFGYELHFHMVGGYLTCAVSTCLYYCPPELLTAVDSEVLSSACSSRANGAISSDPSAMEVPHRSAKNPREAKKKA